MSGQDRAPQHNQFLTRRLHQFTHALHPPGFCVVILFCCSSRGSPDTAVSLSRHGSRGCWTFASGLGAIAFVSNAIAHGLAGIAFGLVAIVSGLGACYIACGPRYQVSRFGIQCKAYELHHNCCSLGQCSALVYSTVVHSLSNDSSSWSVAAPHHCSSPAYTSTLRLLHYHSVA
jgi:hypothetical protein